MGVWTWFEKDVGQNVIVFRGLVDLLLLLLWYVSVSSKAGPAYRPFCYPYWTDILCERYVAEQSWWVFPSFWLPGIGLSVTYVVFRLFVPRYPLRTLSRFAAFMNLHIYWSGLAVFLCYLALGMPLMSGLALFSAGVNIFTLRRIRWHEKRIIVFNELTGRDDDEGGSTMSGRSASSSLVQRSVRHGTSKEVAYTSLMTSPTAEDDIELEEMGNALSNVGTGGGGRGLMIGRGKQEAGTSGS